MVCLWSHQQCSRVGLMPRRNWPTHNGFHVSVCVAREGTCFAWIFFFLPYFFFFAIIILFCCCFCVVWGGKENTVLAWQRHGEDVKGVGEGKEYERILYKQLIKWKIKPSNLFWIMESFYFSFNVLGSFSGYNNLEWQLYSFKAWRIHLPRPLWKTLWVPMEE